MSLFDLSGVSNMNQFHRARRDLFQSQSALSKITEQITTGKKFLLPSEDIGAASRSIRLQSILEQYETFGVSIQEANTKLQTVDGVLAEVNSLIIDMKAQALDAGDSGASAESREATAEVIQQTLTSLVGLANTSVAGQFLFSGFDSSQTPFQVDGNEVVFYGDANEISTQISQGQYIPVTLNPNSAFGALSVEQQGTADLNPRLSFGQGSVDGHTVTAVGTTTTFTDSTLVASGVTAADLVGREVYVSSGTNAGSHGTITGYAAGVVTIDAADAFPSSFDTTSVYSISRGRAGTDLDSLNAGTGVEEGSIVIASGSTTQTIDLSTAQTLTDVKERIEDAFSSITVTINAAGTGLDISNGATGTLTISSSNGGTTAEDLKINGTAAGGTINGGDANPAITSETRISEMVGAVTDPLSLGRIHVVNGSRTADIDLSSATNVREMINLINNAKTTDSREMHLNASINEAGTGINIQSRLSGAEFSISNYSAADDSATEMGWVTMVGTESVSSLNQDVGLTFGTGTDFVVRVGTTNYDVDLSSASTLNDIITTINTATGGAATASINNVQGNKLQIASTNGTDFVSVTTVNSNVAEQLGFTPVPANTNGTATSITGNDVTSKEVDSIFTSAIKLTNALLNNNASDIQLAAQDIEDNFDTLLSGRAKVGGRLIRLELTENLLDKEKLFVQEDLSNTLDIDMTEALTELQAQQISLQAALSTTARILDLSLINFI